MDCTVQQFCTSAKICCLLSSWIWIISTIFHDVPYCNGGKPFLDEEFPIALHVECTSVLHLLKILVAFKLNSNYINKNRMRSQFSMENSTLSSLNGNGFEFFARSCYRIWRQQAATGEGAMAHALFQFCSLKRKPYRNKLQRQKATTPDWAIAWW